MRMCLNFNMDLLCTNRALRTWEDGIGDHETDISDLFGLD